jgi:D-beta-D-heptose 7-phosphate kinase/D-beta-D-heptose 1-phosphate adenosyltransferase
MESSKQYDVMLLSGGFDPVHYGHVLMFEAAKQMANIVVVGVNSDEWLTRKKGKPFMTFDERRYIINALGCVDRAWAFLDGDDTANNLLHNAVGLFRIMSENPGCKIAFGNGGDRTKENVPEQETCAALNIDMVWGVGGETKVQSSSDLLNAVRLDEH